MPIEAFFTGKGESPFAMEPDELVTEIQLPIRKKGEGSSFQKLTFRSAIDYALVSASAWLAVEDGEISSARIAIGGAGAAPLLLKEAAGTLIGKRADDATAVGETATQVMKHASAFMVENVGATLTYRRKMSGVLAKRALTEALERVES
jgi:CO/xanthine dehydrogenase FAD-binding subunit